MTYHFAKKKSRGNQITETIMGSINQAIEKQGESKMSWKKEEIDLQKEVKEKELALQRRTFFMQKKKIDTELTVLEKKCEVEVQKSRREAELIEEQKKLLFKIG